MTFLLTAKIGVKPAYHSVFVDWQAKLNAQIAGFPGFVSLEILSPSTANQEWLVVQRFNTLEAAAAWSSSENYKQLKDELESLLGKNALQESGLEASDLKGVTEVFVTNVSTDKEPLYRSWIAKIHQAEAKFPGFRGVYVQSPAASKGTHWITFLQFDTPDTLETWLTSKERREILKEGETLITSLETHRVLSPYAGWFPSMASSAETPSIIKQTMLILLVLFPIVMLQIKFLLPLLQSLHPVLATFIANALSVTLISWPFLPIAIHYLGWWLTPPYKRFKTLMGTLLVAALYLIEIILFMIWR